MATAEGEKAAPVLVPAMPIPSFGDIGKAANDLINKDFYHVSQGNLEVKLKAPSGTNVTVKGKQGFDGVTTGSFEGKHTPQKGTPSDSPTSIPSRGTKRKLIQVASITAPLPYPKHSALYLTATAIPNSSNGAKQKISLTGKHAGITITESWATSAILDSKIELTDVVAPGVKIDLQNLWSPAGKVPGAEKLTLAFKNPNVHSRAFLNYRNDNGNIDAVVDVTAGHEGILVGGEAGYDLQKAAVTRYSIALGYQTPKYSASITGIQNLSVFAASFYQKVDPAVEVGIKAGYDVQAAKASGLEVASKYKLDPLSFAKIKLNDRGIAALAYSTKLNAGTTIGLGLSLDTNKLNEAGHKIGTSLTFEG